MCYYKENNKNNNEKGTHMFNTKIFSERLKSARTAKHISQADLAKAVGVSSATISSYETVNGAKIPSLDKAEAIAAKLGVSLDWLCGKDEAGKVKITDFNTETFLRSLVVVLSEMTMEYKVEDNKPTICIGNWNIEKFISQVQSILNIYHNGALSTDLFEACVERIVSPYKDYSIYGSRFLSSDEACAVVSSLRRRIRQHGLSSIKQGINYVSLDPDPTFLDDWEIFVSEKEYEECKQYNTLVKNAESEQGGELNGSNNPQKE